MSDKPKQQNAVVLLNLLFTMCEFFRDQRGLLYAAFSENERHTVSPVDSSAMRGFMQRLYFAREQKALRRETAQQVVELLEALQIDAPVQQVYLRTAFVDGALYYDLGTRYGDVVQIDAKGCCIGREFSINFLHPATLSTQVMPDLTAAPEDFFPLVRRHFRTDNDHDALLMAVYLSSLFLDGIDHPILILHGQKGASKTTTARHIGEMFSPGNDMLLTLPSSEAELARLLARSAFVGFDNTDGMNAKIANLLCQAVTGGTYTARKKYTDDGDVFFDLHARVAINGVSVCSTRSDILDRAQIVELKRLLPEERLTSEEVEQAFQADLPKLLGACFRILSRAFVIFPTIKFNTIPRMATYYKYGIAITIAMGIEQREFEDAYEANVQTAHELVTDMNTMVECLRVFLQRRTDGKWEGRWIELYKHLRHTALENDLFEPRAFPGSASALSKHLHSMQSDLQAVGITMHFGYRGKSKIVSFNLDDAGSPEQTNGDGLKPDDSDDDYLDF